MKNLFITTILAIVSSVFTFGQTQQGESFILNQHLTGNQHYKASQFVEMNVAPGSTIGFQYIANGSNEFIAEIDPFMVFPPEEGEFGGPNPDDNGVVGSIAGVFDVSDLGQATYTIPIQIPNDFKGMIPSLAISYTSQSSNGLLGIGWNLAGISSISRTGSTVYHDGLTTGIKFDENDNFVLDGQRLMKVSDLPNGTNNCEYRTEQESFSRVFSKKISVSYEGPESFIVHKKDGSKWYYGSSEYSRMAQTTSGYKSSITNYLWLLDRVEDVKGNYIEYNYTKYNNSGEIYIDYIKYTGFTNADKNVNIAPNYEIKFMYEERLDKDFSFIRDIRRESKQILKQIIIKKQPENKDLYTYTMNYVFDGKYNCLHNVSLTDEFDNSYNPLSFEWTKPETHPTSTETIIPEIGESLLFSGDFNGDGFSDFLKLPKYTGSPYNSDQKINLLLNNKNGGFELGSFERNLSSHFYFIKVCDINGDLKSDFLYCESFDGYTFKITPFVSDNNGNFTIFNTIVYSNYLSSASAFSVGDFLGLGKTGLLVKSAIQNGGQIVYSWKMYYFNDPFTNTMEKVSEGNIDNWGSINLEGDFNGDGKTDIMVVSELNTKIYSFEFNEDNVLTPVHFYNSGFPTAGWHRIFTGDFNGDGRTDVLTYDITGAKWDITYFKETGFDWPYVSVNIPGGDPGQYSESLEFLNSETDITHFILDFDGNGKDDIVTLKYTSPIIIPPQYLPSFESHINIAYMFPNKNVIYKTDKFINQTRFLRKTTLIGDFFGKGNTDILISNSNQNLRVYDEYGNWIVRNVTFPTILKSYNRCQYLITHFDDGMDNLTSVEYDKLTSPDIYTNSNYYDLVKGFYDIIIPLNVVKRTIVEIVPTEELSLLKVSEFKYEELKLHRKGKGLLGFTKLITSNNLSNIISVKTNDLNTSNAFLFPLTNKTYFQQIRDENLLSEQKFSFTRAIYHSNPRVFMLQLNSQLNHLYEEKGVFKKTELTKYTYDNLIRSNSLDPIYGYGNMITVTQSVSKSKLYEHHNNYDYKSETSYTYNEDEDYTDLWLVSLVEDTKTTQSSNEAGSVPIINKTTNIYYPKSNALGFPFIMKTIEKPNDDDNHLLSVEKAFLTFDLRGNLLSTTVSAPYYQPALEPRSSSTGFSAAYHYRFPTSSTNALGNTSTSTYDPVYGTLKTSTGSNGLTTHYDSNPLGTFSKTISPDGIISTTVSRWAVGHAHAPKNAYYYTWQQTSGSPELLVFYHKTGVELGSVTFGFDGSAIYVDKIYNDKGLLYKESLPYKKGETPKYTVYLYDDYNRLETLTSPDNTTTTTAYAANQVSVTIKNGNITRTSTKKYNAAGWLTESTDNFGGIVKNEYYCNGNLRKTYIVGQPATTVTLEYDHRGNRTLLNDPNYGPMTTIYNAYGELVKQTNPRNETTSFAYDKLGRKINETGGPEGNITWSYSTSPKRIGTLENIIKNNHRTNYLYDNLLRLLSETEIIEGASYTTQYTYDELGRLYTTTHPTGIKLRDGYNDYGYHTSVTLEKNNKQLWKTENVNPMGLVTKFKTGNGLVTEQAYYPLTMRPYTVKTAKSGSDPVQDLEYGWYGLGNLEYRKKWLNRTTNTTLTESFTYDGLDRLITGSLNGTTNGYHVYDIPKLGNMTYKYSDGNAIFRNAVYGTEGFGPHAITEVTTANPILTGPRQDIIYNGYDKVKTITEGYHSLQIQYGHHRQRTSQQYTDGTNAIEKVWAGSCEYITKNGQQTNHTYLTGPMGVFADYIINPDGTEEINYIHKDHLGSWHTITDENGNLLQEQSFDAWGNRRDPHTWRAFTGVAPEPRFDRGFTGHEHLYAFNLINMNGRFYDPVIGRMLSPDNYMQAPGFTQSFNRYSYCFNNPLLYSDPSGDFIWAITSFIASGIYEMWKPGGWGGWETSGKNSLNAGLNGLISGGGGAPVSPMNLLKYGGKTIANRYLDENVHMGISSGNWSYAITPGFGFGKTGLTWGANLNFGFDDGRTVINGGSGIGRNMKAFGVSFSRDGYGGGYYYTNYGNVPGPDEKPNPQAVGGVSLSWPGGDFRWENDFFAQTGDKWRTNAMEFTFGDLSFGTSVYTNDPSLQKTYNGKSITWGENQSEYNAWEDGRTYLSPIWFGFRIGNQINRFGYSHKMVQDLTQNFLHQQKFFKAGNQNYYLNYDYLYTGPWGYNGYYNPFSLF